MRQVVFALVTAAGIACAVDSPPTSETPLTTAAESEPGPIDPAAGAPEAERAEFDHSYAGWTALLAEHVHSNGVDYAGLRADRTQYDAVLESLSSVSPKQLASWSDDQRFAFWINTYNAFCIQLVVDNYPIDTIKSLGGSLIGRVWDKRYIPLNAHNPSGKDKPLSLNDVEHEILRKQFLDARLHAAINCASESCPPLRAEAFTAKQLDKQLDAQMRAFVLDPTRNTLDKSSGRLRVSSLFDWFADDFKRDAGSVRDYIARYAEGDTKWIADAKLKYADYSWALNDAPQ